MADIELAAVAVLCIVLVLITLSSVRCSGRFLTSGTDRCSPICPDDATLSMALMDVVSQGLIAFSLVASLVPSVSGSCPS